MLQGIGVETDPKPPRSEAVKNDLPQANPRSQLMVGPAMATSHSQLCPSPGSTVATGLSCSLPCADTPLYLYLNQVALSDTSIIFFNSHKSVFALEERMRTYDEMKWIRMVELKGKKQKTFQIY